MIKATDLIKKETVFIANGHEFNKIKAACSEAAITLYKTKLFAANDPHESTIIIEKYRKLAARFEREFLRENKKPKFIILYGCTELVNMNIFAWDTGFDTPYYENAIFENEEEARKVAESENLQSFIIVEVSNEN